MVRFSDFLRETSFTQLHELIDEYSKHCRRSSLGGSKVDAIDCLLYIQIEGNIDDQQTLPDTSQSSRLLPTGASRSTFRPPSRYREGMALQMPKTKVTGTHPVEGHAIRIDQIQSSSTFKVYAKQ